MRIVIYSSKQAFTLVEVLVALALIVGSVMTIYLGVGTGYAMIERAREDLRATQLMLEKFEAIRLMIPSQLESVDNTTRTAYYDVNATNGAQYSINIRVRNTVPVTSYKNDIYAVDMTVTWTSGGKTHTRTMSSYAAKQGLQQYVYNKHH